MPRLQRSVCRGCNTEQCVTSRGVFRLHYVTVQRPSGGFEGLECHGSRRVPEDVFADKVATETKRWFIGRGMRKGVWHWIEAINGGPFTSLAGAKESVGARAWMYEHVRIVELGQVRVASKLVEGSDPQQWK